MRLWGNDSYTLGRSSQTTAPVPLGFLYHVWWCVPGTQRTQGSLPSESRYLLYIANCIYSPSYWLSSALPRQRKILPSILRREMVCNKLISTDPFGTKQPSATLQVDGMLHLLQILRWSLHIFCNKSGHSLCTF